MGRVIRKQRMKLNFSRMQIKRWAVKNFLVSLYVFQIDICLEEKVDLGGNNYFVTF